MSGLYTGGMNEDGDDAEDDDEEYEKHHVKILFFIYNLTLVDSSQEVFMDLKKKLGYWGTRIRRH